MRRIMDLITSLVLIIILWPFFILISLTIKMTSRGPVFFKQKRIGQDNHEFMLYKFRTMKIGTPNVETGLLKDSDSYITGVGKVLRKSSMDELPQLINIFKGDMTFVGPRPALYSQYDLTELRTKEGVDKLLPGITGWAQVNGRDELDIEAKVGYDKEYLKRKSLRFDISILMKTIFKVLKADGVVEGGSINDKKENISKEI